MNRITLNNKIQMPMLGFGTFLMGGSECEESVLAAIRSGYRMIDTAEAYGNEETVGSAIVKSGIPREELFLVTKVNFRSYENTRETVEASLNKLKTSYLDLVLLHWPFGNYYAAWRELEKMYHEGKIRAIGVSNFDPGRLIDLIEFDEVVPAVRLNPICSASAVPNMNGWKNIMFSIWLTLRWVRGERMKCSKIPIWCRSQKRMVKPRLRSHCGISCRAV